MARLSYETVKPPTKLAGHRTAVLMLLHGVGANERSMLPLAAGADPRLGILSVRGPLELGPDAYGWFHVSFTHAGPVIDSAEAKASRLELLAFIAEYRATQDIDDVYLMGFSQGAIMATVLATTSPNSIQGAVALSGRFPPEFLEMIATPEDLAATAIWVGHGVEDRKLPIHHGRALQSLLQEKNVSFSYTEFSAGHEITPEMQSKAHSWLAESLKRESSG